MIWFLLLCKLASAEPLQLQAKYIGEQNGMHIGDEWIHVEYWDEEEQAKHELTPCTKLLSRTYIYVITLAGRMIISDQPEYGRIHHSTLSNGQPVLAAGLLLVNRGKITLVDSMSGHYKPTPEHEEFAKAWLKERGFLK